MGLDTAQFVELVYETLDAFKDVMPNPPVAQHLVVETLAHESDGFTCLKQVGGPALGMCQMELPTWNDLWFRFLQANHVKFADLLSKLRVECAYGEFPKFQDLRWNIRLAIAMCRLKYFSHPAPLPDDTLEARAAYWGYVYQTTRDPAKIALYMAHAKEMEG